MRRPRHLGTLDFPVTHVEPCGYDYKAAISLDAKNIAFLTEQHNNLVHNYNNLLDAVHQIINNTEGSQFAHDPYYED